MMGITGAFSSLGINERSGFNKDNALHDLPKNYSTMSLPNLVSPEELTISPNLIRNNYSDYVCYDEIDCSDQPIDFSRKYCETKLVVHEGKTVRSIRPCTFNKVAKSYNSNFTMYAETDLDQPTDYSRRYAEDDSDPDERKPKTETVDFVQDTVKTYCTEDTPYETPFNFSTSTSMSDLRIDDKTVVNKLVVESAPQEPTLPEKAHNVHHMVKSEYSSGLMSPEKPVNYCDEGTPRYFSRVPSCGSLNCEPPKQELTDNTDSVKTKEPSRTTKFPTEIKAVKFEDVVNYAEETPLMFSRSSSLASLDSIEQHSIHDDRSSVVSDFSRLTSGLISPSELPDSPSQTVPPSPKPRKTTILFSSINKTEEPISSNQNMFEDEVKKFKMESTPLQFSTATSLSSLIGDDEIDSKILPEKIEDLNNDLSESSEDEDILAACINVGMQNNRYSLPISNTPPNEAPLKSLKFHQRVSLDLPRKSDPTCDSLRTYCTEDTPAILSQAGSNSDLSLLSMQDHENKADKNISEFVGTSGERSRSLQIAPDSNELEDTYDAERIAVECSPLQQIETEKAQNRRSRRSSFSSLISSESEEEALLQECILAGMPQSHNLALDTNKSVNQAIFDDNLEPILAKTLDDEDANILADCIKTGMKNNRYTKCNQQRNVDAKDYTRNYYDEESHSGPSSDLEVLLRSEGNSASKEDFIYLNGSFSDEDDEGLLSECVRFGIAKIAEAAKLRQGRCTDARNYLDNSPPRSRGERKGALNTSLEDNISDDSQSMSSFSDVSRESERALLQDCIQAGMPKRPNPQDTAGDLTPAEKALLQQCILEGMKKCQISSRKTSEEDGGELTEAEQALLRQCILAGMPKNKNLVLGGPSGSRDSAELTESERVLLHQCILAGMPKSRKEVNKQWGKRSKEEKLKPEHNCCIHCPRNQNGAAGRQRSKRKGREKRQVVKENRDVNILYMTSQILTMKNEVVDRSYEEWI